MALRFGVLGPLGVWSDEEAVEISGAKRRGLLAFLLAHAGEPQPLDRIVEALWGDVASSGSEGTVQTYVSQLRKLFGADGPPIVHRAGGYALDIEPTALDASRFEAAVAAASAVANRDQRLALLDEALRLWRGSPLDEFAGQAWADERSRQWTRMYVLANQLRIAALLDSGRDRDALPTLEQLVAAYPLHEPFWSQLIVARYRCGQQADALAAAREVRTVLATELGIEPGPELIELEKKVLAQDLSLDARAVVTEPGPESRVGTVVEPLPAGIVTFLLTDIAGSTALWDVNPDSMAKALVRHEDAIAQVVHSHDGRLLKSRGEGDATLSVFAKATDALAAAVALQRRLLDETWPGDLDLPTRIALHTGEAQLRDGDYYGGTLNRAARIRGIADGGEILLSHSTHDLVADVIDGDVELVSLGEHEMRGMRRAELVYGVAGSRLHLRDTGHLREDASASAEPDALAARVPGNLPIQVTSLVGRDDQLPELHALVRAHRLVTLTGAGGVGKTSLAFRVAADLAGEFPDGIWVVEFAPVADPAAVPDAVASALHVTQLPGATPTDAVLNEVSGRRMLIVFDNCEHLLHAAAQFADVLVTRADTVHVLAASRESLRVAAEHVWSVPTLDASGPDSPAVELFVRRARAVCPTFALGDPADVEAATEICQSLDGLALAIELAAARMLTMSPTDVRDRLRDRFRMLSGSGGGFEHHQTLGKAVAWSYDLLGADERTLLDRCSVFADGFDLTSAANIRGNADGDEYAVLDLLDSLVRKSLITTQRADGHVRFGMLETIRQFGEERLQQTNAFDEVHALHASYFAQQAEATWSLWNGPDQLDALNWVDREFANLRAAFGWAADHDDIECAVSIAAHTAMLTMGMQRFESVSWVEEILSAATEAEVAQLPRLYTAGCVCGLMGRPEVAVERARCAQALEADARFDGFEHGWSQAWEAFGHRYCGQIDTMFEICDELTREPGLAHVIGQVLALSVLSGVGRSEEARALAGPALTSARDLGIPYWIAYALTGNARAFVDTDPAMAMDFMREALEFDRRQRLVYFEVAAIKDLAGLEEALGRPEHALEHLETAVSRYHTAGNHASIATTLCFATVLFNRLEQPELAATIYGMSIPHGIGMVAHLPGVLDQLRGVLGDERFDRCVDFGAAMEFDEAMELVRREIASARRELATSAG